MISLSRFHRVHTMKNHLLLEIMKLRGYVLWRRVFSQSNPCSWSSKRQFKSVEILMVNSKIFKQFSNCLAALQSGTTFFQVTTLIEANNLQNVSVFSQPIRSNTQTIFSCFEETMNQANSINYMASMTNASEEQISKCGRPFPIRLTSFPSQLLFQIVSFVFTVVLVLT